jgi:ATP-dependent DNA helicase RecQ
MPASNIAPARSRGSDAAPDALGVLNAVFGLPGFRGEQQAIVRHVTDGGNCLVLMPTGGGKSLCYQLPSLLREGCGIVVSPLKSSGGSWQAISTCSMSRRNGS